MVALLILSLFSACSAQTPTTSTSGNPTGTTAVTTAGNGSAAKPTIRVGTKDFTESLIVGELYALALEDAGFKVERVPNIAGSIIHTALVNNEIDLYP